MFKEFLNNLLKRGPKTKFATKDFVNESNPRDKIGTAYLEYFIHGTPTDGKVSHIVLQIRDIYTDTFGKLTNAENFGCEMMHSGQGEGKNQNQDVAIRINMRFAFSDKTAATNVSRLMALKLDGKIREANIADLNFRKGSRKGFYME